MHIDEFKSGAKFAVFGIENDMQFNSQTERLSLLNADGAEVHASHVIFPEKEETHFTAFIPAFGFTQPVMIAFSRCEEK